MSTRFGVLLSAALLLGPITADAAAIAASFSLPQTPFGGGGLLNGVDGFEFKPTQNIRVTELGWYDQDGDGLLHSHPVAIFDALDTATLASVTVSSASVLDAASSFRFESLAVQLELLAGHSYIVAGFGEGPDFDPYVTLPAGGVIYGAEINFTTYRFEVENSLVFPTGDGGANPFFGANFRYDTSSTSIPEPGSIALIGLALIAACAIRRQHAASPAWTGRASTPTEM